MRRMLIALVAAMLAVALEAAPATPAFTSSFTKPPAASLKALKATIGKPFKTGFVFIDGKYLPPPYTVARYGTTIRINGVQVTGEIIPWEDFIKTQEGVTMSKTESAAPAEPAAEEPEPEFEEEEDDDSDSSLDDLFDDEPAPKKVKKAAPKRRAKPKPRKPTVTVSYSFNGQFTPNEKTKAYVARINKERTRIDKNLRSGGYYFFGSRYSAMSGDAGAARPLLEKLPDIMRDSSTPEAFRSALFSAGFSYFPRGLMTDIYRHRYEYPRLLERRKVLEEERKWTSILGR